MGTLEAFIGLLLSQDSASRASVDQMVFLAPDERFSDCCRLSKTWKEREFYRRLVERLVYGGLSASESTLVETGTKQNSRTGLKTAPVSPESLE